MNQWLNHYFKEMIIIETYDNATECHIFASDQKNSSWNVTIFFINIDSFNSLM